MGANLQNNAHLVIHNNSAAYVSHIDSTGTTHQPPLFYEESFFSNHLRVIILADLAHGNHGAGVLVGSGGVQIMEGGGVSGVPVATGKVHTHREVDLTSSHDEVQEGIQLVILQDDSAGGEGKERKQAYIYLVPRAAANIILKHF